MANKYDGAEELSLKERRQNDEKFLSKVMDIW
jgi:hypothetical protein